MGGWPGQIRDRAVAWLQGSVRRRLTAAMLAVVLTFTLLTGATAYGAARWQLRRTLEGQLRSEALLEARRFGYRLATAAERVADLARNALLSTAGEGEGRASRLAPILRASPAVLELEMTLTLCDSGGQPIASTLEGGHPGYPGATWLRAVLDVGLPNVAVVGSEHPVLLLAQPVFPPSRLAPEGALVAELDLQGSLLERAAASGGFRVRIADGAGRVLADSGGAASWADMFTVGAPVLGAPLLQELGLRVEVGAPKAQAFQALSLLMAVYAVGAALLAAAALLLVPALSDRLMRPVLRLSDAAARIARSGRFEAGVAVEGGDEIARLARSFNEMLRRLQQATEARLAALHERNEELVRSHAEAERLQMELGQAQKLEAVGRLAAGIAHEINTPIQYIGDNTHFLDEAFRAGLAMLDRQQQVLEGCAPPEAKAELAQAAEELDLDYIRENAARTIERTLQGTERVASIVRAMKEFAHPDQKEMVATDLNRALQATLEVARNEYKYVADVETSFAEIPLVTCHAGDLNQVFLNVVVNAAHAIADVVKTRGGRGTIRVATAREPAGVRVSIADTGGGIPERIRDKVFDPFFTTKEVGRGTGQGLAIARNIVDKHGGSIGFDSVPGQGTTFHIRLPEGRGTRTPRVAT